MIPEMCTQVQNEGFVSKKNREKIRTRDEERLFITIASFSLFDLREKSPHSQAFPLKKQAEKSEVTKKEHRPRSCPRPVLSPITGGFPAGKRPRTQTAYREITVVIDFRTTE